MIALIKGKIIKKSDNSIVIETGGGVGYEILIDRLSAGKLPILNEDLAIHVQTVMNENSIQLFGFLDEFSREIFNLLISVSKIGPKTAMQILSGITPSELLKAIKDDNIGRLAMIHGVGRKTSERLIMELKDKCSYLEYAPKEEEKTKVFAIDEVRSALLNLGFRTSEIEKTLAEIKIKKEEGEKLEFEELLKLALKKLKG